MLCPDLLQLRPIYNLSVVWLQQQWWAAGDKMPVKVGMLVPGVTASHIYSVSMCATVHVYSTVFRTIANHISPGVKRLLTIAYFSQVLRRTKHLRQL